ncbi:hypothetical protein CDL15_Pgr015239 [Punica granatum]|nr:hypothetical protein CDL15_Pgr015239 [Punica granatum]
MISDGRASGENEASDSNSSTVLQIPSKRPRNGLSSGRFKGVVPQHNGHWGAQIYANHQRIWLGTFKSEEEAAMAYDSAAINLRSGDSHRNFPWTPDSVEEPNFQSLFSQEAVLSMIKDGSYRSKFANYLRIRSERNEAGVGTGPNPVGFQGERGGFLCRQLFQKELTPSDVGKLNRLVIPKKYAVKYFPRIHEKREDNSKEGGPIDDVQLVFYDRLMRMWKFRYCYWSSSQSFVFTRGWSRFVKEKVLRANDTVSFCLCECTDPTKENRTFYMINVCRNVQAEPLIGAMDRRAAIENRVGSGVGGIAVGGGWEVIKEEPGIHGSPTEDNRGFRLFGVQIN